jgi:hypothetical protein
MRLSSFTWLITYISLAIALVWFFASTTYCIYSYTLLLGASWPIGSALVIGAAAFISAPWDLIMRLGWKGFGTLLWRNLLAINDQFHLWIYIWFVYLIGMMLTLSVAVIRDGLKPVTGVWFDYLPPESKAHVDWILREYFPHQCMIGFAFFVWPGFLSLAINIMSMSCNTRTGKFLQCTAAACCALGVISTFFAVRTLTFDYLVPSFEKENKSDL